MLRLLVKLALASAAVAAVWTWVPVKGRTMGERWTRSASAGSFIDGAWAELMGPAAARPTARREARATAPRARAGERPVERHSEDDRRAVDRILSDRLETPPTRP
jgi:hypothetical protein